MTDFSLTGKICVVTGGTKGVGHGIVRQLLGAGASVLLTSRSAADCAQAVADLGREFRADMVAGAACDMADPMAVDGLLDLAAEQLGPVDALVANAAAVGGHGPVAQAQTDDLRRMHEVNVTANFALGQQAAEQMASRGGGSITFITSIAASTPMPNNVAYAASKAGLTSMAMSLAAAYATHEVRVNCVAPGLIRSFSSTQSFGDAASLEKYARRSIPLGRVGEAEEVGAACVFLASSAGAYVTAAVLPVDGGSAGLHGAVGSRWRA